MLLLPAVGSEASDGTPVLEAVPLIDNTIAARAAPNT